MTSHKLESGMSGFDEITNGGYLDGRSYMVRGEPGVGKTLLGLHFLSAGLEKGERALFVNMGEPVDDLKENAADFGFPLGDIHFLDLTPSADFFTRDQSYDIFPADEVEENSLTDRIVETVTELSPDRVFVDPLTQLRYLTSDDYQFRKQVLSFLQFLKDQNSTVLFTSQDTPNTPDDDLQFMSDGIIELAYEDDRRQVEITKFRGSDFSGGTHAVRISTDGMTVYPQLRPKSHSMQFSQEQLSSGVAELDALLNGGIERGTVSIVSGPSGVGKTTTGSLFMKEAAKRGERSVVYLLEESLATFQTRGEALGIPIGEMLDAGKLEIKEIEASELAPEEFANDVRTEVEEQGAEVVMIDGLDGYRLAVRGSEQDLLQNVHALGKYLKNMGVTAIYVSEVSEITGHFSVSEEENISYLADNILFLRYLEYQGELRKAIGVLKKRASDFERTLREFELRSGTGVYVGDQLTELRGILEGTPDWPDE